MTHRFTTGAATATAPARPALWARLAPRHGRLAGALLLGAVLAAGMPGARAEREGREGRTEGAERAQRDGHARARVPLLPKYSAECGACHLAYPPGMLPAASWARLMGSLPRHFGTDASLDTPTLAALSTWLAAHAAGAGGAPSAAPPGPAAPPTAQPTPAAPPDASPAPAPAAAQPQDRITQTRWFVRKHRELDPSVWQRAAVRSAANCAACHSQADQGVFNEHQVRIPR